MALFGIEIKDELIKDEDKLVEKLYEFLAIYLPLRLKYNTRDELEDATQETIMYILRRVREENMIDNLERYIFNRAHSFVSSYIIRPLQKERAAQEFYYLDQALEQLQDLSYDGETLSENYINENKLKEIVDNYPVSPEAKEKLYLQAVYSLVQDYGFLIQKIDELTNVHNELNMFLSLVLYDYAVYLNRRREGKDEV